MATMAPAKKGKRRGRARGSRNKGYWHRSGRGWYVTAGKRLIPLNDEQGNHIKDPGADADAQRAYARYLLDAHDQGRRVPNGEATPVWEICRLYLDHCRLHNREATYYARANLLYDFCTGFPARFRDKGNGRSVCKPSEKDRLHKAYGGKTVAELIPLDVDQWLDAHPDWGPGTRRMAVQALKRAMNFCRQRGLISSHPLEGFSAGSAGERVTYFTPELEEELYRRANPALTLAVKVCIRTGARYGSEFCKLTAKHVHGTAKGQVWRFSEAESKNRKPRTVLVAPEIAEIVRRQVAKYPDGQALFRNAHGKPWTRRGLRCAFLRLKKRLAANGIRMDSEMCMYSTRHTYAKRSLGGYWTGKPCTIEQLAALMGNTREVCWQHYARWCDAYRDPLWDAVGSQPDRSQPSP
jgi:integrase